MQTTRFSSDLDLDDRPHLLFKQFKWLKSESVHQLCEHLPTFGYHTTLGHHLCIFEFLKYQTSYGVREHIKVPHYSHHQKNFGGSIQRWTPPIKSGRDYLTHLFSEMKVFAVPKQPAADIQGNNNCFVQLRRVSHLWRFHVTNKLVWHHQRN